jgi:hypothetical protein
MRTLLTMLMLLLSVAAFAQNDDNRKLTIPVIFHIVYTDTIPDNGISDEVRDKGNSTTRLTREKLLAELKDLDQDFQGINPDIGDVIPEFQSVIGNPNIHFILQDVRYVKTTLADIRQSTNSTKLHELSPAEHPERFLNVYISTLRFHGGGSEGYTNVPVNTLPANDDYVNLNYMWVGLHYRLLSHEVGHWLGLYHMNDEHQINTCHITDVPVQNKLTDIPCVICTKPSVRVIHSQRNQFAKPNTNNYMDYSGCRRMFSLQQAAYVRNLIFRLRPAIWNDQPVQN